MVKQTFDFSNPQLFNEVYLPLIDDTRRYKILYGGRNSGKSDFIAQALIISMLREKFCRALLVRRWYAHIKKSQFQTIIDYISMWGLNEYFHVTLNPLAIKCKINDNSCMALGLDKPDNIKSTKDPTQIWYEEADQISEYAFWTTSGSIRSARTKNFTEWISFNPQREGCFINKQFFPNKHEYENDDGNFTFVKSPRNDTVILHTTYRDNKFLNPDQIKAIEAYKNIDKNFFRVNTLGLWGGALRGLIYPEWNAVEQMPPGNAGDTCYGIDYGYNNPTAIVKITFYEKKIYIRELEYLHNHTHSDIAKILITKYKDEIGKNAIIVDSAAPELIKELQYSGFNAMPVVKGAESVYKGILLTKQYPLNITTDSINVIHEIQSYTWKETKDGDIIDEPVKVDDHAMDAIRYVIQSYGIKYWIINETNVIKRRPRIITSQRNSFYNF